MGNLVFQATLGGQVNLVGPNTASTFNLNVPAVSATLATTDANTFTASQTFSAGTANGVAYLNGSKVLTTGSALTFDGTNLNLVTSGSVIVGTGAGGYGYFSNNGVGTYLNSTTFIGYALNNSEQMRLTSTGLGIGTSSPAVKLDVDGIIRSFSGGATQRYVASTNSAGSYEAGVLPSGNAYSGSVTNTNYLFYTNATEKMRLDSAGNLGLGVTPSGGSNLFQMADSAIMGFKGPNGYVSANAYYSGGWKYAATGNSTQYVQTGGQHQWNIAPSGTAGNAITFTQAMTLDASGNLLVGTTTASPTNSNSFYCSTANGALGVNHASGSSSGNTFIAFTYNAGVIGAISQNGTTGVLYNITSDYRLKDIAGPVTNSGAFIDKLNPVQGSWKADGSRFIGFLAHELQEASETVVGTGVKDGEEMQSIDYSNAELIANLVAEIQSLRKRLAAAGI